MIIKERRGTLRGQSLSRENKLEGFLIKLLSNNGITRVLQYKQSKNVRGIYGGAQGVATFYWAVHGASLVIILVFSRLCRKTITRGKEDTRSGTKKRFMPWAWIMNFVLVFAHPPPPLPQTPFKN